MPRGFGPRFAVETAFLLLVAVGAAFARFATPAILLVMAIAWVLVALAEWLASRELQASYARPATSPARHGVAGTAGVTDGSLRHAAHAPAEDLVSQPAAVPEEALEHSEEATMVGLPVLPVPSEPSQPEVPARDHAGQDEVAVEPEPASRERGRWDAEPQPVRHRLEPLQPRPARGRFWRRRRQPAEREEDAVGTAQPPRHVRRLPPVGTPEAPDLDRPPAQPSLEQDALRSEGAAPPRHVRRIGPRERAAPLPPASPAPGLQRNGPDPDEQEAR